MSDTTKSDEVRSLVRAQYGAIARAAPGTMGCGGPTQASEVQLAGSGGCCGPGAEKSLALGYSADDLASVPEGANMGLGCGNPQAIAALRGGETVLDLGAGGGFDCFLAAKQVGATGRVIGVDMTPDMISKARANAKTLGAQNVEFRLGEIEHLPVSDGTIDVILSNCVINLSPDKDAVFREAFRVLKPGGRLAISDVVKLAPLPEALEQDVLALTGCIAGAVTVDTLQTLLVDAGFVDVRLDVRRESRAFIQDWMPGSGAENYLASAIIEATRPMTTRVSDDTTRARATAASSAPSTARTCCGPTCCPPEAKA